MPKTEAPTRPTPGAATRTPERLAVDVALHLGAIALFLYLTLDLIQPFLGLILWSGVIAVALHPAYLWAARKLGGRRRLAAGLVTAAALLVVLGPVALLVKSLIGSAEWLAAAARTGALRLPPAPHAVADLPLVGATIAANWELAATNLEGFLARFSHLLIGAGEAAVRPTLRLAEGAAMFLAAVVASGFLHIPAPRLVPALHRRVARVLGPRGGAFVDVAGETVRSVARGVIGVAAIQALLVGVGLMLAGVPAAGVLTLAVLVLAIVQLGAHAVVYPTILWLWMERDPTAAALFTVYLLAATFSDLALKPMLLRGGKETPSLVLFAGVLGGTISYGLIGLFLGPILLAIAYQVLRDGLYPDAGPAARRGGMA